MKLLPALPGHGCGSELGFRKKFRLFFGVAGIVVVLSVIKAGVHALGFEFLQLNTLLTSGIGGAIFIIGFLLSSILADYKEAEKIPAEIRTLIEGIAGDLRVFASATPSFDLLNARDILSKIIERLRVGLGHHRGHADLPPVLAEVDRLTEVFGAAERQGMPANYVVRLRTLQDGLRRCMLRVYHIQRVEFVPSVHVLVQTLVSAIVILLLFLKTEGAPESALLFGFIAYMFVYAVYLIRLLEQPFHKDHGSLDDVSLFLLHELESTLKGLPVSPAVARTAG